MKLLAIVSTLLATSQLVAAAPRAIRRSPDDGKMTAADLIAFVLNRYGKQCTPAEAVSMDEILGASVNPKSNLPQGSNKRPDNKIHGGKQPPNHKNGGKKNPDDEKNGGEKHPDPKKGGNKNDGGKHNEGKKHPDPTKGGNPNPGKNHGGKKEAGVKNEGRKRADEMNVDNKIHSDPFRGKKHSDPKTGNHGPSDDKNNGGKEYQGNRNNGGKGHPGDKNNGGKPHPGDKKDGKHSVGNKGEKNGKNKGETEPALNGEKNGGKKGGTKGGKNDGKNDGKNGGKNDGKNDGKNGGKNNGKDDGKNGGKNQDVKNEIEDICSIKLHPKCPEFGKMIWDKSHAGDYGDAFLNKNDWVGWPGEMDKSIFNNPSTTFDCEGIESDCGPVQPCRKFVKAGHPSAYPIFFSLKQIHSYLREFHELLQDAVTSSILAVNRIHDDFQGDAYDELSTMAILGASLSILSAAVPPAANGFGLASGTAYLLDATLPADEDVNESEAKTLLYAKVERSFNVTRDQLEVMRGSIFGAPKSSENKIPPSVQTQSFQHHVMKAMGDGKWMVDHPTRGLPEALDTMYHHMKQSLAWEMLRYAHKAFVFADTGRENEDECLDDSPNIWDPEHNVCFRLFQETDYGVDELDHNLVRKLWDNGGEYNMDRLKTFRNAWDCWVSNSGKAEKPELKGELSDGELPKCYFAMKVIKGERFANSIYLDGWEGEDGKEIQKEKDWFSGYYEAPENGGSPGPAKRVRKSM